MKLLRELVARLSSANPAKHKVTNNYTFCSMLLHYGHCFTDPQNRVDLDCACVAEWSINSPFYAQTHLYAKYCSNITIIIWQSVVLEFQRGRVKYLQGNKFSSLADIFSNQFAIDSALLIFT